jgi:diadenylate cyclase
VSKTLGTRHRAAIGLTEETDAVVVVVSEEEGSISMVREGRITRDLDAGSLRTTLLKLLVE